MKGERVERMVIRSLFPHLRRRSGSADARPHDGAGSDGTEDDQTWDDVHDADG
jgi:hypothetical protein